MTEEKWNRIGIAAVVVTGAVLLAAVIIVVVFCRKGDASYRSIKIVELSGDVAIDRDGTGRIDASENMNLVSGDRVTTATEAYVVLQLDTDKYVMLEENGIMQVVAEGDESNAKTEIHLEQGSVLNDIQNPLNENSSYEIVTPRAAMSVRGTVFEVRIEDGNITVLVYDGSVEVTLDGKDPVLYTAGEYTKFTGETAPQVLVERGTISDDMLDDKVREWLQKIEDQGRQLNVGSANLRQEVAAGTLAPTPTVTPEPTATPASAITPEPTATPAATTEPDNENGQGRKNYTGTTIVPTGPTGPDDPNIYEYDGAGQLIKVTWRNADGRVTLYTTYEYDAAGNVIKRIGYNPDGSLSYANEYGVTGPLLISQTWYKRGIVSAIEEYNEAGLVIKSTAYNEDGSVKSYSTNEYNDAGQFVKHVTYNADGSVESYFINEYNDTGQLIKRTTYDADGNVTDEYNITK